MTTAHQRLNSIGSQVNALVPGDWQPVTLTAGWTDLPGYVPAQVRIQQTGLALLVGTIAGGLTPDGTIIGSLPAGYYSTVWSQAFDARVMAGAAAATQPGVLTNLAGDLNNGTGALVNGTVGGTAFGAIHVSNTAVTTPTGLTLHNGATSTPVNMNTPMVTVSPLGTLTLTNCPVAATELSFCEHLPLA